MRVPRPVRRANHAQTQQRTLGAARRPGAGLSIAAGRALKPFPGNGDAHHRRRAARADRESAPADDRAGARRHRPRAGHEHVVFRRRALGPQRAAIPASSFRPRVSWPTCRPASRSSAPARSRSSPPTCACGRKTRTGARWSPASSRIAASRPARWASRSGCGSSSRTAFARPRRQSSSCWRTPVTAGCRMIKSPAEIALMQRANDITIEAYKAAFAALARGDDAVRLRHATSVRRSRRSARRADRPARSSAQYTAFPHGSITPQQLKQGDVVLVDGGCSVERLSVGHHAHDGVRQAVAAADRRLESREAGAGGRVQGGAGRRARASRSTPPHAR